MHMLLVNPWRSSVWGWPNKTLCIWVAISLLTFFVGAPPTRFAQKRRTYFWKSIGRLLEAACVRDLQEDPLDWAATRCNVTRRGLVFLCH